MIGLFIFKEGVNLPHKPKRPCGYPNCPNLTDGYYCKIHQRLENKKYEKFKRDTAQKRKYNSYWKKIRDEYKRLHPFCEECLRYGRYVLTEEIHHVLPLRDGGTHDAANLKSLCKSCHSRIHRKLKSKIKIL